MICEFCGKPLPALHWWERWTQWIYPRPLWHDPKKYPQCKDDMLRRFHIQDGWTVQ